MKAKNQQNLETTVIHAGEPRPLIEGAVSLPIFQSSTFEYSGEDNYHDIKYIRLNNTPNHVALHRKLAAMEKAESALVSASGMATISSTLLAFLKPGDHILLQPGLYGGTHEFITKDLTQIGIEHDFIKGDDPDSWKGFLKENTKIIYVESMTNPLLEVIDLRAVTHFAKENKLLSMVDNTFASPVNFRPMEWGFDLSLHSASKYLNGHSDIVAGVAIGSADLIEKITHKMDHLGGALDPHACFLLHRGIKTLVLRMRYQNESALAIARFLENSPKVKKVNYPGLESNPGHALAREFFDGFGGMLSFELEGGLKSADKLMETLEIPIVAPSLGGVESLITLPATTSHAGMPKEEREALGITDSLVRLSVGIEATEDIISDLEGGLNEL